MRAYWIARASAVGLIVCAAAVSERARAAESAPAPPGFCAVAEADLSAIERRLVATDGPNARIYAPCEAVEARAAGGGGMLATLAVTSEPRPPSPPPAARRESTLALAILAPPPRARESEADPIALGAIETASTPLTAETASVVEEGGLTFKTDVLPGETAAQPVVRMTARDTASGRVRSMATPYAGRDTLRFLHASLKAALIADRIRGVPQR